MKNVYTNLTQVYTKKGDYGETGLFGGTRISKSSIKVEAYGCIDEANTFIGIARATLDDENLKKILYRIQEKFLVIGGYLASDSYGITKLKERIVDNDIENLEKLIDEYSKKLLPLYEFIIPGDNKEAASLHVARTIVRRAERRIVSLKEIEELDPNILKYINRVSDILFVLARIVEDSSVVKNISKIIMKNFEKNRKNLSLEIAKKIILAGEKRAKEIGKDFIIAIVTSDGYLVIEERMDNAIFASIDIAFKKAYTSVALKMPTSNLKKLTEPTGELYGLQNDNRYIIFGGGELLKVDEVIVGAVGVSGGSVEEDIEIAKACVEEFEHM